MALYEYRCLNCETIFEVRRPMSEAGSAATCPSCSGNAEWLPSVFASKDGYTLRGPKSDAFRGSGPSDRS